MKSLLSAMNISFYYLAVVLLHFVFLYVIFMLDFISPIAMKKLKIVSISNVSETALLNLNDMNVDFVCKKHYDRGKKLALW